MIGDLLAPDGDFARCGDCGQIPEGLMTVSLRGEVCCASHPTAGTCFFCQKRSGRIDAGWCELAPEMLCCPECSRSSVDDMEPARRQVAKIRRDLRAMGFELRTRVRVALADHQTLEAMLQTKAPGVLGITYRTGRVGSDVQLAAEVMVLRGLPALWFARTLVHENMHAWIGENGVRFDDQVLEEGACEALSYEWVRRQRGDLPAALAESLLESPDPIYGEGLRRILDACRSGSIPTNLQNRAIIELARVCHS